MSVAHPLRTQVGRAAAHVGSDNGIGDGDHPGDGRPDHVALNGSNGVQRGRGQWFDPPVVCASRFFGFGA